MIPVSQKILRELDRKSYLGGLGRGQGFGKLTPPKAIEVLRSLTRELMSMVFAGNSLRGTWTGGGITISMPNSGRYMVRGRRETLASFGFRNRASSSMHRYAKEVEVVGGLRWRERAAQQLMTEVVREKSDAGPSDSFI